MINAMPVYRVALPRESELRHEESNIKDAKSASRLFRHYLGDADRKHFVVMLLDTKHRPIGINMAAVGSLNACPVHPREVYKPSILANACSVLFCHNHPSGHPAPSEEDKTLTRRLVEAGAILEITVLDHIILGDTFYSMRRDYPLLFRG